MHGNKHCGGSHDKGGYQNRENVLTKNDSQFFNERTNVPMNHFPMSTPTCIPMCQGAFVCYRRYLGFSKMRSLAVISRSWFGRVWKVKPTQREVELLLYINIPPHQRNLCEYVAQKHTRKRHVIRDVLLNSFHDTDTQKLIVRHSAFMDLDNEFVRRLLQVDVVATTKALMTEQEPSSYHMLRKLVDFPECFRQLHDANVMETFLNSRNRPTTLATRIVRQWLSLDERRSELFSIIIGYISASSPDTGARALAFISTELAATYSQVLYSKGIAEVVVRYLNFPWKRCKIAAARTIANLTTDDVVERMLVSHGVVPPLLRGLASPSQNLANHCAGALFNICVHHRAVLIEHSCEEAIDTSPHTSPDLDDLKMRLTTGHR